LIQKKHNLFIKNGDAALPDIRKINSRLNELLSQSETEFPLSTPQAAEFRANLWDILLRISAMERQAIDLLQSAILK